MRRLAALCARGEFANRSCSDPSRSHIPLVSLTGSASLLCNALCVTYLGACSFRTTVLADPTAFEEPLLDTSISIVLDKHGSLLSTSQLGIADKDTMSVCVAAAKERHEAHGREIYSF